MIKLIVTDLDGTLLNEEKKLPNEIFDLIEKLHEKGIIFAVASGRAYFDIKNIFLPVHDKIIIIGDNGTVIYNNNEKIHSSTMSYNEIVEVVDAVNSLEGAHPNLTGAKTLYIQEEDVLKHPFTAQASSIKFELVDDLKEASKADEITKISILDLIDAESNSLHHLKPILKNFNITVSGQNYLDIMKIGVNKGAALSKVQELLNVDPKETMVFGDYLNDIEMMQKAYYSYAMENAHPKIKEVANFLAPSNEKKGVITIISDYLKSIE